MVRKSLFVALLLAIATPLTAQDQWVWSSKRPDAQAPLGVVGGQMLERGQFDIGYRFSQATYRGVWFGKDSLPVSTTLEFYEVAPVTLENLTHTLGVAYAPLADVTLFARMNYSQRSRSHLDNDGVYYVVDSNQLGDLEVAGLFNVLPAGPVRAHLQLGALIPTGQHDALAMAKSNTEEAQPYDMRAGAGTFAFAPGLTLLAQNQWGTVGLQGKGLIYIGTNSAEFRRGNEFEVNGWGAYRINRYFSVSGRVAYTKWDRIHGEDPALDPFRDPGNDGYFMKGSRTDIPVGLNLYMPEGARFGGQRLSVEYGYPISRNYDGPQLGARRTLLLGWQVAF